MGKITGFLEDPRRDPVARTPEARLGDFQEFYQPLQSQDLAVQAGRCMDCGVPFCQSGVTLRGSTAGCPTHNLIPEWNDLVYRGAWHEALQRLLKTASFPEFTGRICPAPCEGSCTVGLHDSPVAIRQLEQEIIERGFKEGWVQPRPPTQRTQKTVAVVGSGPAGLAAAQALNARGHTVTVFERADRLGGLLMYGIPPMKLDKRVVERRIALMRAEGIQFQCNTVIGAPESLGELQARFDAVVLCIGAGKPRDLPIPGRELAGIHWAMDFLRENTRHLLSGAPLNPALSARDKDVVVIGGGDTGTDAVATALRQGCRHVTQLEILSPPPASRSPGNPWPEYPRVMKHDYGHVEAATVMGQDPRTFQTSAIAFHGNDQHAVRSIDTARIAWETADGGHRPRPIPDGAEQISAQLVLLALGFLGPEDALLDQWQIVRDDRSNIQAPYGSFTTNRPGIFAAGDARRGQSLVVWAIQEGREAARACHQYLMA